MFKGNSTLQTLTIGSNVTDIGQSAFEDCDALTQVVLPNAVEYVHARAFRGCDNLTSFTIGSGFAHHDDNGQFVGSYSPFEITDANINEIIYLGADNTLGYATAARTLRSCRAHFVVPTASTSGARAMTRAIVNFGDDETTGIRDNNRETITNKRDDQWYTLSGQRIDKPSAKGVYIRYLNFSSAQKVVKPALDHLDRNRATASSDYTNLLIFAGCCQAHFNVEDSVVDTLFERAYQRHLDNIDKDHSKDSYRDAVVGFINIAYGCRGGASLPS